MFRASNEVRNDAAFCLTGGWASGRSPRYAASFPGLEISDGGEFTVYKKGRRTRPNPNRAEKPDIFSYLRV